MAIDTAAKRFSAMTILVPSYAKGVIPSGSVIQADRQDVAWSYRAIESTVTYIVLFTLNVLVPGITMAMRTPAVDMDVVTPNAKLAVK